MLNDSSITTNDGLPPFAVSMTPSCSDIVRTSTWLDAAESETANCSCTKPTIPGMMLSCKPICSDIDLDSIIGDTRAASETESCSEIVLDCANEVVKVSTIKRPSSSVEDCTKYLASVSVKLRDSESDLSTALDPSTVSCMANCSMPVERDWLTNLTSESPMARDSTIGFETALVTVSDRDSGSVITTIDGLTTICIDNCSNIDFDTAIDIFSLIVKWSKNVLLALVD